MNFKKLSKKILNERKNTIIEEVSKLMKILAEAPTPPSYERGVKEPEGKEDTSSWKPFSTEGIPEEDRMEALVDWFKQQRSSVEISTQGKQNAKKAEDAVIAFMNSGRGTHGSPGGTEKLDKAIRGSGRGKKFPAPKGPRGRK